MVYYDIIDLVLKFYIGGSWVDIVIGGSFVWGMDSIIFYSYSFF